jgi:hypothetical protein
MDAQVLSEKFWLILVCGAQELFEDNHDRMACAELLPTSNAISEDDLRLFFIGLERGIVTLT